MAFIRLNLFVKVELHSWLDNPLTKEQPPPNKDIQGVLFENLNNNVIKPVKWLNLLCPKFI